MIEIRVSDEKAVAALAESCGMTTSQVRAAIVAAGPDENDIRNHLQKVVFRIADRAKRRALSGSDANQDSA